MAGCEASLAEVQSPSLADAAQCRDRRSDDLVDGAGVVDSHTAFVVRQRFERTELGGEQRRRHEVASSVAQPLPQFLWRNDEFDEDHIGAGLANQVAVRTPERRTRDDATTIGLIEPEA